MRRNVFIAVWFVAFALTAGVFQAARTVLTSSFADIEADTVRQGIERVRKAIEADLNQLEATVSDYAQWDDTYIYLQDGNQRYVDTNFTRASLDNLRVNLVWITDVDGKTVLAIGDDDTLASGIGPLPQADIEILRRYQTRIASQRNNPPLTRLLRLSQGALAYSAVPIVRSDHSGPPAGILFFGRYLDQQLAERAAKTSQLPVAFAQITGVSSRARLPDELREWVESAQRGIAAPELQMRGGGTSKGYTLLRDVSGVPLVVLSTSVKRDVLMLGQRTITGVVIALIVGFGFVVLGSLILINRSWRARESTEQRYLSVVEQLDDCILLADAESGRIVEANPALWRTLGYDAANLGELRLEQLNNKLSSAALRRVRDGLSAARRMLNMVRKDGTKVPMEITATSLRSGNQTLVCLVARDVTNRRKAEKQRRHDRRRLTRLALHDSLTSLPNRVSLQQRLPKLIANADRDRSLLALLYIDLDHFKDVNDSLGHSSGDRLLANVAKRLRSCVATGDLVARMGGDEFVVIATGLPAVSAVDYIARRIQESLSAPNDIDGVRLEVVVSIGISVYPTDGTNLEQLLKHADIALYQAKARGRGNHQFFTDEMKASLSDRLELEHALRRAVGSEQLFLEYQPSFDLQTGRPVGFEALMRWNHPQLGLVPPNRFIPIAEQGSLILELGAWVMRRVCRQIAEWKAQNLPLLPVSINVTPRHFEHGRLVDTVSDLTREFDIDANLLHFEITEGAMMHNSEQHLGALQALRNLGSRVLIDDFGTGYSSLSYLKHLPIDTLKIDRAFVRDMATDSSDAAIVSAIIAVAGSLGLHVVAEGVETQEQVQALLRLNCYTGQGFYFSRPIPPDQCAALLHRLSQRRLGETVHVRVLRGAT